MKKKPWAPCGSRRFLMCSPPSPHANAAPPLRLADRATTIGNVSDTARSISIFQTSADGATHRAATTAWAADAEHLTLKARHCRLPIRAARVRQIRLSYSAKHPLSYSAKLFRPSYSGQVIQATLFRSVIPLGYSAKLFLLSSYSGSSYS
ncbi:MAG: hypothetical protein WKG07_33715 [Hymenobacter sp.]